MSHERLLALSTVSTDDWHTLKTACARHDVENGDDVENVWDVRDYEDPTKDEIYLWGRDGWEEGFWHAVVNLDGDVAWITRGNDKRAMPLMRARELLANFAEKTYEEVGDGTGTRDGA